MVRCSTTAKLILYLNERYKLEKQRRNSARKDTLVQSNTGEERKYSKTHAREDSLLQLQFKKKPVIDCLKHRNTNYIARRIGKIPIHLRVPENYGKRI